MSRTKVFVFLLNLVFKWLVVWIGTNRFNLQRII